MKMTRTSLYIAISTIALIIVLIIQVNWILQSARLREELFSEKARMVLTRTSEALRADKKTCRNLHHCTGNNEARVIDSLFRHYMELYNFRIDYHFEVKPEIIPVSSMAGGGRPCDPDGMGSLAATKAPVAYACPEQPYCYKACIEEGSGRNRLELKLTFPTKEQFILAEMRTPFITSVILILVVMVMSWRTIRSLMKEKRLSEHTTDFLNNMTHEFKTPLTNIALAGRGITRDPGAAGEEKIMHYTGIILEENEKLRLQVEQVLSMTALERGEIPLQKSDLDFHHLIGDAVRCMSLQVEHREGTVEINPEAHEFLVYGDRTHLTNALCSLLDNAVKYSRGRPEISIRTRNTSNKLVVEVSDRGIGIQPKYRKKVFEKFFRVPTGDVHEVKGFGLGLAYIRRIVELHGGTITLDSKPGAGTTIILTLPYA